MNKTKHFYNRDVLPYLPEDEKQHWDDLWIEYRIEFWWLMMKIKWSRAWHNWRYR